MADPISVTSAIVGLVAVGCQTSKALRETIQSYKNHPKHVRDLKDELSDLENILQLLERSLTGSNDADFKMLDSPLRRCNCACKEFEQALLKCTGRNEADKASFRGWLKIRWMGNDINGFRDTIAGYKSTIAIAMAGLNLRTTKVSLDVIQEYKDMIQSTTTDLKEHLCNIDETLRNGVQDNTYGDDAVGEGAVRAERESTIQCLEICVQVSNFIEERQKLMGGLSDTSISASQANAGAERASPRQIVDDSLTGCKFNLKSANAQLSNRLYYLSARLNNIPSNPSQASWNGPMEQQRMAEEIESIRQCLDICGQASEEAEKARVNIMEDVATAEDSRQILVSTIGDLIAAHRVTAGARSLQCIGQMSDESLQSISRAHSAPHEDFAQSSAESPKARDSHNVSGRTLGSSNVRTFGSATSRQ